MKKVGLNFLDLRMAVLVQRVVPAAYAFVIHTENPTNGAKDEIFAELVAGLGESIVSGMVPGSSLSFYAKKDSLDKPEVSKPSLNHCTCSMAYARKPVTAWPANCLDVAQPQFVLIHRSGLALHLC